MAMLGWDATTTDNAPPEPLANARADGGRCEFTLAINPIKAIGGGSLANPLTGACPRLAKLRPAARTL